jgi:phosphoribosylformylglycinamidine synthase
MSGTFGDIDVPPTLVSFAVDIASLKTVITPELKAAGNKLVLFSIEKDADKKPVYDQVLKLYDSVYKLICDKAIVSAYALDSKGLAAAVAKMGMGCGLGARIDDSVAAEKVFGNGLGNIVAEVPTDKLALVSATAGAEVIGEVIASGFEYAGAKVSYDDIKKAWTGTLESVFHSVSTDENAKVDVPEFKASEVYVCKNKVAKPTVFIPVFPGTNCEYDSAKAFERAGANADVRVFRNLTAEDIRESVAEFKKAISQAQMIMFPGGFSAGDEPDGSAKFFATAFRNASIKEAVEEMLDKRDGLVLGICNGFQAIIKLGLVPNGKITGQTAESPTLTFNTIGRHISKMAYIKVVSDKSPWLQEAGLGNVYANPASHGEGRFIAPENVLDDLFKNGQIATVYSDPEGNTSMDEYYNINGSFRCVEGITSPDGRVLGKMCHSERIGNGVAINIYGEQDLKIFESGVKYFK